MKNTFYALTIGSDAGIFKDTRNPTSKRFLEYCNRCGRHFTLCYTPPGYEPVTVDGRLEICPTNSRSRWFFLFDATRLGMKMIRRFRPEVIVAQDTFIFGLVGLILKKLSGLPLVIHYHSGFYTNAFWMSERRVHWLLARLGLFVSRRADVIRTVSTDIQQDLLKTGLDPARVFYATPPVEADGFLKINQEKERKIIDRFHLNPHKTFIFIGRLSREKNLPMMIRAAGALSRNHPEIKILIIGEGPEEAMLRKLVYRSGLADHVLFLGAVPYDELKDYIRSACALLITSNYEGTAKVIKEAAFTGRATISTNTSGVRDAIKDGETGLIVPIGDETAFVSAMESFLIHPDRARIMGERAGEYIRKKFDYKKDVDRIVDIWRYAVQSNRKWK
jgi:1,2-diacylglycerol 3-alpha-glucosyltransferase